MGPGICISNEFSVMTAFPELLFLSSVFSLFFCLFVCLFLFSLLNESILLLYMGHLYSRLRSLNLSKTFTETYAEGHVNNKIWAEMSRVFSASLCIFDFRLDH